MLFTNSRSFSPALFPIVPIPGRSGGITNGPPNCPGAAPLPVSVPQQNRVEFNELVGRALSLDPDRDPARRLVNLLAQRRARWLSEHADELILPVNPENEEVSR